MAQQQQNRVFQLFTLSFSPFKDLLNFDDPLNIEAAEHHLRDKVRCGAGGVRGQDGGGEGGRVLDLEFEAV